MFYRRYTDLISILCGMFACLTLTYKWKLKVAEPSAYNLCVKFINNPAEKGICYSENCFGYRG